MRLSSSVTLFTAVAAAATWTLLVTAQTPAQTAKPAAHPAGPHKHPEAAQLKNPVKPAPAAIAAGKALFDTHCASCHGTTGKGDGKMAATMAPPKPPAADFTDATWTHGATDGEIFAMIRDGARGTAMRGFATRLKPDDMWNVVTYVKTLAPKSR